MLATFVQKVVIKHPANDTFLLLIRNKNDKSRPGDYDIPGGSLKDGELHEESLKREVKEETGLEISEIIPVLINTRYDAIEKEYFIYIGYKAISTNSKVVINSDEHPDFKWMTLEGFQRVAPNHILTDQIFRSFDTIG